MPHGATLMILDNYLRMFVTAVQHGYPMANILADKSF